jgi:hypothetical protein
LRLILARNGLKFVSMDRVELVDAIAPFDEYLITLCCDFGLNVGDARVLIEAQRLGIGSIATMDGDMQRASANFDIYTWL